MRWTGTQTMQNCQTCLNLNSVEIPPKSTIVASLAQGSLGASLEVKHLINHTAKQYSFESFNNSFGSRGEVSKIDFLAKNFEFRFCRCCEESCSRGNRVHISVPINWYKLYRTFLLLNIRTSIGSRYELSNLSPILAPSLLRTIEAATVDLVRFSCLSTSFCELPHSECKNGHQDKHSVCKEDFYTDLNQRPFSTPAQCAQNAEFFENFHCITKYYPRIMVEGSFESGPRFSLQ